MQGKNTNTGNNQELKKTTMEEFTSIIEKIKTNKESKAEIEKMVETNAFKKSFMGCFNLGGFASTATSATAGIYRIDVSPIPGTTGADCEDRWKLCFFIAIPVVSNFFRSDSSTLWRSAKVIEIIAQWDKFYPLLEKTLNTDTKYINTIEKTVQNLKHLLAPEILSAGLSNLR